MSKFNYFINQATIEFVDVKQIQMNPYVIKEQNEAKFICLTREIRENGLFPTVFVDENYQILNGHPAYLAADILGFPEIPVIVLKGLSERQKILYLYASCDTVEMRLLNENEAQGSWEVRNV